MNAYLMKVCQWNTFARVHTANENVYSAGGCPEARIAGGGGTLVLGLSGHRHQHPQATLAAVQRHHSRRHRRSRRVRDAHSSRVRTSRRRHAYPADGRGRVALRGTRQVRRSAHVRLHHSRARLQARRVCTRAMQTGFMKAGQVATRHCVHGTQGCVRKYCSAALTLLATMRQQFLVKETNIMRFESTQMDCYRTNNCYAPTIHADGLLQNGK